MNATTAAAKNRMQAARRNAQTTNASFARGNPLVERSARRIISRSMLAAVAVSCLMTLASADASARMTSWRRAPQKIEKAEKTEAHTGEAMIWLGVAGALVCAWLLNRRRAKRNAWKREQFMKVARGEIEKALAEGDEATAKIYEEAIRALNS